MRKRFWLYSWYGAALLRYLWLIGGLVMTCSPAMAEGNVDSLIKSLGSQDHETQVTAGKELKKMGPMIAASLVAVIKDTSSATDTRQSAMQILSEIGTVNDDSLSFFIEALNDGDDYI